MGYRGQDFADFLEEHRLRCIDLHFEEHTRFSSPDYLGPCLLLPETE
jgi:hypothetical protein